MKFDATEASLIERILRECSYSLDECRVAISIQEKITAILTGMDEEQK